MQIKLKPAFFIAPRPLIVVVLTVAFVFDANELNPDLMLDEKEL